MVESFGQFIGLPQAFPGRVIDTPISETAIVGAGLGAALTGMRPFVDLHFADFTTSAMDEIANQAAKIRYMFGGQVKVPLVIWAPDGAGLSAAAHHSQSLEAWFVHTPGLKVVSPCLPYDVKGLIKTSIKMTIPSSFSCTKRYFLERGLSLKKSILSLWQKQISNEKEPMSPVITYSIMVLHALEAAEQLEKERIDVESFGPPHPLADRLGNHRPECLENSPGRDSP